MGTFVLGFVSGIFFVLLAVVAGGAWLYYKVLKPKIIQPTLDKMCALKNGKGEGLEPPDLSPIKTDYGWKMKNLDGSPADVAEIAKGKVVVLNIWSTTCFPCCAEMPTLERLYERFADDERVRVVALSCGKDEDATRAYVNEHKLALPVYLAKGKFPSEFYYEGIPATFIISKSGEIVARHIGAAKWDDQTVVERILSLVE